MIIRRLTTADLPKIDRIRVCSTNFLGANSAVQTSQLRFSNDEFAIYLNPKSDRYIGIGVFQDDELMSFMTAIIDHETKAWYVQMIMSSQTRRASKFNGIELCTDWMIEHSEAKGINTFWYSIPLKYERTHRTAWRKVTKLLSRYDREDMLVVPKGRRVDDPVILKYLMSDMVLFTDMLIRRNTLNAALQ